MVCERVYPYLRLILISNQSIESKTFFSEHQLVQLLLEVDCQIEPEFLRSEEALASVAESR